MNNFDTIVKGIIDELEDIPEDATVEYEVWAIGYNGDDAVTDTDFLLKTFEDPDEAVKFAKDCTLADVINLTADGESIENDVTSISIEVETVVEDEDEGTMNVGTIYYKTIDISPADLCLTDKDYELLDDGTLTVSCELLKKFSRNDYVKIMFADEDEKPVLTYKIISKITDTKCICEFM